MKTFHSSGTPIGIADRMPKWKQTMTNAAIAVGQPPWENNSANGTSISIAVLKWASQSRHRARAQIVGELLEELPLQPLRSDQRIVRHHRRDHEREMLVELRRGRAHPDRHAHQLGGDDHVDPVAGEQEGHGEGRVHLAARGQEDHLVAQARAPPAGRESSRSATSAAPRRWCRAPASARCRRRTARRRAPPAAPHTAATSTGVRAVPLVSGIRLGHGGSRMVLGRNQYRIDPSGGKNRLFSGPNPQPRPMTSNSMV